MQTEQRLAFSGHEQRVQSFYAHGASGFGDCHGGYLNFGLWEDGDADYVRAAERMIETLARWGGVGPEARLLDIGCGFGSQDVYLSRAFGGPEITALDLTWEHVLAARRRVARAGARVQVLQGSGTDLRFAPGSFSHVMAVESVVHFDTRERFFREARRVLQPGGTLLLADYCLGRAPSGVQDRLFLELARRGWYVPRENCDTVEDYRRKLERSGFAGVEIERVGARTIPRYFREQVTARHLGDMARIRGALGVAVGLALDTFVYLAWRRGILEYILVRARRADA